MKHTAVLAMLAALSSAQVVAQTPAPAVRSGGIVTCDVSRNCSQETIDGRQFYVLETPLMIVKVAIDPDSKYNRIQVVLENHANRDITVSPADFRIEMMQPKYKRLSYIEPTRLKLPKVKTTKSEPAAAAAMGNSFMGSSHQDAPKSTGVNFLAESILAPSESATGAVFFERSNGSGMSLLLPIAGSIFEFPYTPSSK